MFADSLLDSHWANRSHRGWTTLASFALQALGVAFVISLPLLYTEGLPKLHLVTVGTPIGPPPGQGAPDTQRRGQTRPRGNLIPRIFTAPREVPPSISYESDALPPEEVHACPTCVPNATGPIGIKNPVMDYIGKTGAFVPPPPKPVARPPRVSRMMEGNLIYKVQPVYPPMARSARIQGAVVLRPIISRSGAIENLQVLTGHPLLVKAAMDAVSQWRYRPYILNDEPVEVETQVTVNFILAGG
jgi:protein TonB